MEIIRRVCSGGALAVVYIGENYPQNPVVGSLWVDTGDGQFILKVYDGNDWRVLLQSRSSYLDKVDGGNL
jgi:hypothetical protein